MDNNYFKNSLNVYAHWPKNTNQETKAKFREIEKLQNERRFSEALEKNRALKDELMKDVDLETAIPYFDSTFGKLLYWLDHPEYDFEEPEEPLHFILYNLGALLIECDKPQEAESILKLAWDLAPFTSAYALEYIESLKFLNKFDEAEESIIRALSFTIDPPQVAKLLRDLGFVMIEKGELVIASFFYLISLDYEVSQVAFAELEYIKHFMNSGQPGDVEKLENYLNENDLFQRPEVKLFSQLREKIKRKSAEEIARIKDPELLEAVKDLKKLAEED